MKARILILTVVGSLVLAASPAYGAGPARQLQFVILPDGGVAATSVYRAPTATAHRVVKEPWEAPNRWQVARDSI